MQKVARPQPDATILAGSIVPHTAVLLGNRSPRLAPGGDPPAGAASRPYRCPHFAVGAGRPDHVAPPRAPDGVGGGGAPVIADSLPVDPRSGASAQWSKRAGDRRRADAQIVGLHDSTQELLKQIQQAQHDNAELRAQIQSQNQNLERRSRRRRQTTPSKRPSSRSLQSQMNVALKGVNGQLAQLNRRSPSSTRRPTLLRKTLGHGREDYPGRHDPGSHDRGRPAAGGRQPPCLARGTHYRGLGD